MKKIIYCIIISCFSCVLQAQEYETGKVIDSLPVANSDKETFALYLPTSYQSNKALPILFVFSPSGNGKNGVKAFVKSAEAYNYILIGSNNSRNGLVEQNLNIAERLINHTLSNFPILENRIYLAGFSGGARLATAIASISNQVEGVIACGAGFISMPSYMPSLPSFSYAGLCGNQDMNYQEMLAVKSYLERLNFQHTLFTFDGKHQWPPSEQLLMAFNWFEIEASKKGYIKKSEREIRAHYLNDLSSAKTIAKNNQPLIASEHYNRILTTYSSFFELDTVRQTLQAIEKSKNYSNTLQARKKAFEKENILNTSFLNRFDKDLKNPKKTSLKWWDKEFEKMKKQAAKANGQTIEMHERVRFKILATVYITLFNPENSNLSEPQRLFCDSLIALLVSKE